MSLRTDWMSPEILEKVLNVLRTHIARKLGADNMNMSKKRREADSEKIDVFRGAGWQMAYYFRKQVHRHAVLLKNKQMTFEAFSKENPRPAPPLRESRRKRKRKSINIPDDNSEEEAEGHESQNDNDIPQVKEEEDDETITNLNQPPLFRPDFGEDEDEDEKPEGKPKLRVSYDGFSIFGKLLVVIVEPYPPLRGQSSLPVVNGDQRELSVAPSVRGTREESEFAVPGSVRGGSRQRSESTLPLRNVNNPLFRPETPVSEDEEDLDGFRARSQSILGYNPAPEERDEESAQP